MEEILSDAVPPKEEIYQQLARTSAPISSCRCCWVKPSSDGGVRRLLKALRHEVPGPEATAQRLGIDRAMMPRRSSFKTYHQPHAGKLSLARVFGGRVARRPGPQRPARRRAC